MVVVGVLVGVEAGVVIELVETSYNFTGYRAFNILWDLLFSIAITLFRVMGRKSLPGEVIFKIFLFSTQNTLQS